MIHPNRCLIILFLLLELPVLPGLEKLSPCQGAEDIHRGCLADIHVFAGLLAQIEVGAFATAIGHDIGILARLGEVFIGEVFSGAALEFGRNVHFQELDFEMFLGRPGENDRLGQVNRVLGHELHNGILVLGKRIGYRDGDVFQADTSKTHLVALLHHQRKKAAVIRISAPVFVGQVHRCVRYGSQAAVFFGEQHAGKLDEQRFGFFRLLFLVLLCACCEPQEGKYDQYKSLFHALSCLMLAKIHLPASKPAVGQRYAGETFHAAISSGQGHSG